MNLIIQAAKFAEKAHRGQLRKYTNRPYIEHPGRVAARLCRHPRFTNDEFIAAAWLHDVVEDCGVKLDDIWREFNCFTSIHHIVHDLTNPSKQHPELSRAERKALDRKHIASLIPGVKCIKLADRIDNLLDMAGADEDFKRLYGTESMQLYREALVGTDPELEEEYLEAVKSLGIGQPWELK
jgi:(p)ppGpp synthase/HD superfamily hydrolase